MNDLPVFSPSLTFAVLYLVIIARYFVVSGGFYFYCAWAFSDGRRKISSSSQTIPQREIFHSLVASLFFALAGTAMIMAFHSGWTQIYLEPQKFGYAYLPISFLVLVMLHETYFYWTHVWMHKPRVFQVVHRIHHESRNPTAWASFSFHPLEAAIEALILPLLVLIVPVHYSVLMAFLLFMTVLGVINHLGYEIYPKGFARHPFFKWWISATHHQMHHEKINGNFGLYFNFWDRLMKTEHKDYGDRFDKLHGAEASDNYEYDLIIVGGGLSGGLLAYYLNRHRPDWKVLLIEKESSLGGNHTWSFYGTDMPLSSLEWISPLITRSWSGYEVRFPDFTRFVETSYHSITSMHFQDQIATFLDGSILTEAEAVEITPHLVRLKDGRSFTSKATLDARGPDDVSEVCGYQKFIGLDVKLSKPHGLRHPILMDARVPQTDGFRFFYVLPWSDTELLIEDTCYSTSNLVSVSRYTGEILHYAETQGWSVQEVQRREIGVLPIPLSSSSSAPGAIGLRGKIFNDTTGYSLPDAVRLAERIGALEKISAISLHKVIRDYRRKRRGNQLFYFALNRMMFLGANPSERYRVLAKFYGLPTDSIQRFYRGELNLRDRIRLLSGRPPISAFKALSALIGSDKTRSP